MSNTIPAANFALIRGTGTWACDFPAEAQEEGIHVLQDDLVFETPYGQSAKFQLLEIDARYTVDGIKRSFLSVASHGWKVGIDPIADRSSEQVFWVLQQAGVKKIIVEGAAGSVNEFIYPGDLVIPTDFFDFTKRRPTSLGTTRFQYLIRLKQAICPQIADALEDAAARLGFGRVYKRGLMGIFEGPRFESPAEVRFFKQVGCDVLGQSMVPEVYLAREIGACYAAAYLTVNFAEGISEEWESKELDQVRLHHKADMARLVLRAMKQIPLSDECGCLQYRQARPAEYRRGIAM
ncbi:MAG: MTAP family purine nucleoside phosphorylase [Chloroflexi bacterium]|nr:MTAP family purine nucleoside phosphorylase [Chloroflexota bacterium]MCL5076276.1 MTAP family purine nucleoside phosphorylase [Chloroflexota bacterium]